MKKLFALFVLMVAIAVSASHAQTHQTLKARVAPMATGGTYTVTLTWTPSVNCTIAGESCPSFNVYRCQGVASCSSGTKINTGTIADTGTFTDLNPGAGSENSYYVTDVVTGNGYVSQETGASNVTTVIFPLQPPTNLMGTHN